jgi:hypothetical protein
MEGVVSRWQWQKQKQADDEKQATMRILSSRNHHSRRPWNGSKFVAIALFALVFFWLICFLVLTLRWREVPSFQAQPELSSTTTKEQYLRERSLKPHPLSRSGNVTATADVRGNLGPAQVVVQVSRQHRSEPVFKQLTTIAFFQPNPGKDWIHDRWQAASNMHGKNILGAHWIHLDFGKEVVPQRIVLDWEAAYADEYRLEASLEPISGETPGENVWILFDAADPSQTPHRSVEKTGKSPGVKTKTPLHVIHTLNPLQSNRPLRYLRLYILKSAMGWGVSLWQLDVYGFHKDEVMQ